jgi:SAM-dependent methyltransferase
MLATMVMLGMQRIVIDAGRITASMRFHIDTRDAANEDRSSQTGLQNRIRASGSFGVGPWGASAEVENTISYVSTQRSQTSEEMNTDLDLNSSVELVFKTDYLPLERLAGGPQLERIKLNTLNPEAEMKIAAAERTARLGSARDAEAKRAEATLKLLAPPALPKPAEPASPTPPAKPRQAEAAPPQPASGMAPAAKSPNTAPTAKKAGQVPVQATALAQDGSRPPDVPFVPTQDECIPALLDLASPRPGEILVDLGCGDGRLLIAAATRYGCRGVGYDIDPACVEAARRNVAAAGLAGRVRIEERDLFSVDLSEADIVTLYLLPQVNARLVPQLERVKPGARIVSHDFAIDGLVPDRVVQEYVAASDLFSTYFLFIAPIRRQASPVRHRWRESSRLAWEDRQAEAV